MTEEFKNLEHHPDTRAPVKRGRPFFSIRRRVDPDAMQKALDTYGKQVQDSARYKLKFMLVTIALFLLLAPIVTMLLIAYQNWKSAGIFSNPFLNFLY